MGIQKAQEPGMRAGWGALVGCLLSVALTGPLMAQTAAPAAPGATASGTVPLQAHTHVPGQPHGSVQSVQDMAAVVVSGEQPGPGLWRVSRDGHVLWILGTVSPLPRDLQWRADEVRQIIADSQAVLGPPGWGFDADVGFFKRLTLVPAALKAARDPQGRTLREVLPADVHARWLPLKQRYLGNDRGVEKDRPMAAGSELLRKALREHRLGRRPIITPVIEEASRKAGLVITSTRVSVRIENPRAVLKQARGVTVDDTACFSALLDKVEHEMPMMVERANAWAVGDVGALQALAGNDAGEVCIGALEQTSFGRAHDLAGLQTRARTAWLAAARASLLKHPQTFASVPMEMLAGKDGVLAQLEHEGYAIEAPPQ